MAVSVERWLFGSVLFPGYHYCKGDAVNALIAEYEKNQWQSPNELRTIQALKLGELVRHAARFVPYYRQFVDEASARDFSVERLSQLPPLTKAAIRQSGENLRAENAANADLEANSTSGSTGEPLRFYTDRRSSDCRKASVVLNRGWAGIALGDREVRLWGSPLDNSKAEAIRGRIHGWLTRCKMLNAYDLSPGTLRNYLEVMRSYRPRLLIAYPSVLVELAQVLRDSSDTLPGLRSIIVSAETLFPFQRALFAESFGVPVFDRYGSREVGDIAQECEEHDGLHINTSRVLVEIVRDDFTPCEIGEVGDLLITDLDNFGMPFIRYAIGDRAAFATTDLCRCGRGYPRLAKIEGRSMDVVRFPNGSAVGGTYWTIILRKHAGIEQFQVVQSSTSGVVIHYVASRDLTPNIQKFISDDVYRRAGGDFRVRFEHVTKIPANRAGKRRLVINELQA